MDGGPLRAAPAYAGGNFDGGRGVDRAGKHLDAGHVLFFLHAERAGIRLRRAAAKPSVIVALVRTISRKGDGICVPGNWVGRRSGAVDFAHSGATFWLASGASNAGTFDSGDCTSRGIAGERAPAREKEHSESWIRGRARRVHHNSFFSADAWQHVFHSRSQWRATKLETFSEFGSSFRAEPSRAHFVAGPRLQHRRAFAHGLAGRSLSEKIRHGADLHAGCCGDSAAVCGAGAGGHLHFRSGVWGWPRRRLYDCSADGRGNFRRATPGRLLGVILTAGSVAEALSPWLVGRLRDTTGSYSAGFLVLIGLGLLGAASAAMLPKGKKPA